jgi:hypothetical protein
MPSDVGLLVAALVFLPILGGAALMLAGSLWQVCNAPTTPRWQAYLWFLAVGFALFNLPKVVERFAGSLPSF